MINYLKELFTHWVKDSIWYKQGELQGELHGCLSESNFHTLGWERWKAQPNDTIELNNERLEYRQAKGPGSSSTEF